MQTSTFYLQTEQASQNWNRHFDKVIKVFGFIRKKKVTKIFVAFLILYMDDKLLIGNDVHFLKTVNDSLKKSFLTNTWASQNTYWALKYREID